MDYSVFLYTKTFQSDWSFLVVPPQLSRPMQNSLREVLSEGIYRAISPPQVETDLAKASSRIGCLPSYCFPIESQIVLLQTRLSDRQDYQSRPIWEFAGTTIDQTHSSELKAQAAELLLSGHLFNHALDYLSHTSLAPLYPPVSRGYSFARDPVAIPSDELEAYHQEARQYQRQYAGRMVQIPFTSDGWTLLKRLLLNPYLEMPFFAFGPLAPELLPTRGLTSWSTAAATSQSASWKDQVATTSDEETGSKASSREGVVNHERPDNLTSRWWLNCLAQLVVVPLQVLEKLGRKVKR